MLPNKGLVNISRGILDRADKTNRSRFFSDALWLEEAVNERRLSTLLAQTTRAPPSGRGVLLGVGRHVV